MTQGGSRVCRDMRVQEGGSEDTQVELLWPGCDELCLAKTRGAGR
jgi:hypothetical protein